MTTTSAPADRIAAQVAPVRVALFGQTPHSAAALGNRLFERRQSPTEAWDLVAAAEWDERLGVVDIALCDTPENSRSARETHLEATVVVLIAARGDGQDVVDALASGAHVCVRGNDPTLIAAYLRSIAQRCDLLGTRNSR